MPLSAAAQEQNKKAWAAARAARTASIERRMARMNARFMEAFQEVAHFPDSTLRLSKKLGVSTATVHIYAKRNGVDLQAARKAARLAAQGGPVEERGEVLPWTVLQLFDTLMAYFDDGQEVDLPESHDEQDQAESNNERYVNRSDPRATWIAWRVFLAAAFGLDPALLATDQGVETKTAGTDMPPYPEVDKKIYRGMGAPSGGSSALAIFTACTGRDSWPTWQARIVALIVGRRGGKSYVVAIMGIFLALCRKYRLKLGTKGMVMILAKDKEQAGVIRGYVKAFLQTPPLRGFLKAEPTQKLIELQNGITIEIRAVSESGTRGYTVVAALPDEIAFWPTDSSSARQDKKVLRALRPAMLGVPGSMIVMLSSPYAKRGELYETHKKAYGVDPMGADASAPTSKRYLVWNADTLTMRPTDDEEVLNEIREEYEDDPDNAKAEYGAQFRDDLESIFSSAAIEACEKQDVNERPYHPRHVYRAFVDTSSGSGDSAALAIAHDEDHGGIKVSVLDKVVEAKPPFDPDEKITEFAKVLREYHLTHVTGDAYAVGFAAASFKRAGIDYRVCELNRSEIYLELLPLVNSGRVWFPDPRVNATWKRGSNQLTNLERRVGKTGKDSVDHPVGAHDDVANAVAGVLANQGPTPFAFTGSVIDCSIKREGESPLAFGMS